MLIIKKKLVTDENMRPVAVQIEYADWLEIQRLLGIQTGEPKTTTLSRHSGTVTLTEDPLDYQERVRREWH